jgi:hypothetical protein
MSNLRSCVVDHRLADLARRSLGSKVYMLKIVIALAGGETGREGYFSSIVFKGLPVMWYGTSSPIAKLTEYATIAQSLLGMRIYVKLGLSYRYESDGLEITFVREATCVRIVA